jgi:hypothetical protein
LILPSLLLACNKPGGGGGPTTATPVLLQTFQGPWKFDLQKTFAQWQVDGVPATQIAQARTLAQSFPMHPDMTIANDIAILSPLPNEGEYKFFALHQHKQRVCGKAWHHEDRNDPGDMTKCYVRLELKGSELHLSVRMAEDAADPSDPDVMNMPITAGDATTCGADAAPVAAWAPWQTYVFVRAAESQ